MAVVIPGGDAAAAKGFLQAVFCDVQREEVVMLEEFAGELGQEDRKGAVDERIPLRPSGGVL